MIKSEGKKAVIKENGKKMYPLEKEHFNLKDGKVIIESEELAKAIQENTLDLFIDEEQCEIAEGIGFGCPCSIIC